MSCDSSSDARVEKGTVQYNVIVGRHVVIKRSKFVSNFLELEREALRRLAIAKLPAPFEALPLYCRLAKDDDAQRDDVLVLDKIVGPSWDEFLRNCERHRFVDLSQRVVSLMLRQLLAAAAMHRSTGITHNDMHADNVLVRATPVDVEIYQFRERNFAFKTHGFQPVLIDFGLCFVPAASDDHRMRTPAYYTDIGCFPFERDEMADIRIPLSNFTNSFYARNKFVREFSTAIDCLLDELPIDSGGLLDKCSMPTKGSSDESTFDTRLLNLSNKIESLLYGSRVTAPPQSIFYDSSTAERRHEDAWSWTTTDDDNDDDDDDDASSSTDDDDVPSIDRSDDRSFDSSRSSTTSGDYSIRDQCVGLFLGAIRLPLRAINALDGNEDDDDRQLEKMFDALSDDWTLACTDSTGDFSLNKVQQLKLLKRLLSDDDDDDDATAISIGRNQRGCSLNDALVVGRALTRARQIVVPHLKAILARINDAVCALAQTLIDVKRQCYAYSGYTCVVDVVEHLLEFCDRVDTPPQPGCIVTVYDCERNAIKQTLTVTEDNVKLVTDLIERTRLVDELDF